MFCSVLSEDRCTRIREPVYVVFNRRAALIADVADAVTSSRIITLKPLATAAVAADVALALPPSLVAVTVTVIVSPTSLAVRR
jgi:hypothetical protein